MSDFLCSQCGKKYGAGIKFCSECGGKITEKNPVTVFACSQCGKEYDASIKFCSECGGRVCNQTFSSANSSSSMAPVESKTQVKLTRAERDTLVKRIQGKKTNVIMSCITAILVTVICGITILIVRADITIVFLIAIGLLFIICLIIVAVVNQKQADALQDKLDKDS